MQALTHVPFFAGALPLAACGADPLAGTWSGEGGPAFDLPVDWLEDDTMDLDVFQDGSCVVNLQRQ